MAVVTEVTCEIEISAEAVIMIAGRSGNLADAALLLPGPPIVVRTMTFDLVRRGRSAEQESRGEAEVAVRRRERGGSWALRIGAGRRRHFADQFGERRRSGGGMRQGARF